MATIKLILAPDESEGDAKALLLKALKAQSTGSAHADEAFAQPAAQAVADALQAAHRHMWADIYREISDVLTEEIK